MNFQELKGQKIYWEDPMIGQVSDSPSRTIQCRRCSRCDRLGSGVEARLGALLRAHNLK